VPYGREWRRRARRAEGPQHAPCYVGPPLTSSNRASSIFGRCSRCAAGPVWAVPDPDLLVGGTRGRLGTGAPRGAQGRVMQPVTASTITTLCPPASCACIRLGSAARSRFSAMSAPEDLTVAFAATSLGAYNVIRVQRDIAGDARAARDGAARAAAKREAEAQCAVCQNRRKDPVAAKCSHAFCKICVDAHLRSGSRSCPTCRASIASHRDLDPHVPSIDLLASLPPPEPSAEVDAAAHFVTSGAASRAAAIALAGMRASQSTENAQPAQPTRPWQDTWTCTECTMLCSGFVCTGRRSVWGSMGAPLRWRGCERSTPGGWTAGT
jgi:hypothetical protein